MSKNNLFIQALVSLCYFYIRRYILRSEDLFCLFLMELGTIYLVLYDISLKTDHLGLFVYAWNNIHCVKVGGFLFL